ncbi:hypothetical protein A1507_09780 [Methylomonas koyamae]|uniref:Uncharacterized protein n=1 Tax=Methylomonas koyamae TaxID=702114 RepID=A0A177NLH7_9GAMM|nr:hypothetical protein A1507_09780 [Methylomonas koyamae]
MRLHNSKAGKDKAVKRLESTIEKLGQAKIQFEREFMLYHEKRQRQLQAQYGVSADQDFANITADNALLLIKKRSCSVTLRNWNWRNGSGWDRMLPLAILGLWRPATRREALEPSWWTEGGRGHPCACRASS